jgi:lipoprotein-releasing system permease protein
MIATKLLLGISTTLLTARMKQSVIAAVGVTFSITMFIALTGFMNGLNGMLDGLILNRTPHVRLYNEIKPVEVQPLERAGGDAHTFISSIKPKEGMERIRNAGAIIASLRQDPRVLGIAPKVVAQAFFNVGTTELPAAVNGIEPFEEERLFRFTDYLVEGRLADLQGQNAIVIGKTLADLMLVQVGDNVQLTTARGERFLLKIVGFYQSGLADLDRSLAYTSVRTAQRLLGEPAGYITDIQVKLHDLAIAPALAKEFHLRFGVDAIDIQQANAQFETGTNVRNIISYAVSVTLLIVAGFGIYNILNMMIYEKLDSIAILKATGFASRDVKRIFISLSLIIGVCGGVVGLVGGFVLSHLIAQIPFETAALPTVKTFPVLFAVRFYVIGIIFALITTYIAGLFPARKAAKVDPVQIIRGK